MVGGGSRSTNVFAALESLKKKKKSDKDSSKSKGSSKGQLKEPEAPVVWNLKPLVNKSWADVEDEDDDDYYATSAPSQVIWGSSEPANKKKEMETVIEEESESEDEGLDEGDEDVEEEAEAEPEAPVQTEPVAQKPLPVTLAPKDTERQLSKKELKKKGLEELDALLAEMGISGQDQSNEGKKENALAPSESKTSKKKKPKKDKQPNGVHADVITEEASVAKDTEEDTSGVDVKERLKKVVSMKKKKTGKEMDTAARAAAIEAAARSARLAAAKKKEKNHYNQQPVR